MDRTKSLNRKVSFRRSDVGASFPDRRDSSRRKKTLLGKLSSMVQDIVADEEEVKLRLDTIVIHESLIASLEKLAESYELIHNALTNLHQQYSKLLETWNPHQRYSSMKLMIKLVLRINADNSKALLIPSQEPGELPLAYAQRLVPVIIKEKKSSTDSAKEDLKRQQELKDKFDGVDLDQINQENEVLHSDLYQMAKRYTALRKLINTLHHEYNASKSYPFFPRYNLLKRMIMDLKRNPAFIEVCTADINLNNVVAKINAP
ncbi:hypothetical protein BV898_10456 [Hypsibius exemplaris]|uniref:Uncharacterized protein n=1 Tax=Hypsibius exemplaris TaxID=2072580 RepID=A0A1W0WJF1_HYPEX|nr:hypothetical protein BV898_10456 [Hypsibius exemplaris]